MVDAMGPYYSWLIERWITEAYTYLHNSHSCVGLLQLDDILPGPFVL